MPSHKGYKHAVKIIKAYEELIFDTDESESDIIRINHNGLPLRRSSPTTGHHHLSPQRTGQVDRPKISSKTR